MHFLCAVAARPQIKPNYIRWGFSYEFKSTIEIKLIIINISILEAGLVL